MKKIFITGLITLLPILLTLLLFTFLIDFLTTPFLQFLQQHFLWLITKSFPKLPQNFLIFFLRLFILILLVVFTCIIGAVARKFFFRSLIATTQKVFSRIPLLRSVFNVATEIAKALFTQNETKAKAFQKPVMTPFPSEKSGSIGFISGVIPPECEEKVPNLVPVFMPTSPHPISGYMMMVPKQSVHDVKMSNEDAVKFTVSCGMIHDS